MTTTTNPPHDDFPWNLSVSQQLDLSRRDDRIPMDKDLKLDDNLSQLTVDNLSQVTIDEHLFEGSNSGSSAAASQALERRPSSSNALSRLLRNPFSSLKIDPSGSVARSMKSLRRNRSTNVAFGTDEATPLSTGHDETKKTDATAAFDQPGHSHEKWKKLQKHVVSGSALLQTSLLDPPTGRRFGFDSNNFDDADCDDEESRVRGSREDRLTKRHLAMQMIRSKMHFTVTQCVVAILAYIGIAVIAFSFVFDEQWTVIDSAYFSVVTFSSVGFGDITPSSQLGQAFTSFFTLSSIACLGIAVGVVGNQVLEAQQSAIDRAKTMSEKHVVTLFAKPAAPASALGPESHLVAIPECLSSEGVEATHDLPAPQAAREWVHIVREFLMVVVVLACFAVLIMMVDPSINPRNVIYFLIITSTTCGFGDVTPTSQPGRLLTALLIPLAVGAMGRWLSLVAAWIMEVRQRQARKLLWSTSDLTYEDLEVMDEDGDGNVTRVEFLEFMLLSMDKVDRSLLDELRAQFASLDADGTGVLSRGDLIAMARKKLHCPTRKLELSRYKHELLDQASCAHGPAAAGGHSNSSSRRTQSRWTNPLTLFTRR
jgi:Ion channel